VKEKSTSAALHSGERLCLTPSLRSSSLPGLCECQCESGLWLMQTPRVGRFSVSTRLHSCNQHTFVYTCIYASMQNCCPITNVSTHTTSTRVFNICHNQDPRCDEYYKGVATYICAMIQHAWSESGLVCNGKVRWSDYLQPIFCLSTLLSLYCCLRCHTITASM
jgi:hypothetical protein